MLRSLSLLLCSVLVLGCSTGLTQKAPDHRATLKVQSPLQKKYTNNLLIKVSTIDGMKASAVDNLRKTHQIAPGRRTIRVTGNFERVETTVTFSFQARARETYFITGRFQLLRNGGIRHYYSLQNSAGSVLQSRSATTRL